MERVIYIPGSQGNIKFLNEAVNLGIINTERLMKSLRETYGAVAKRQTDGTLSNDLKVIKNRDTSLLIYAGYAIANIDGEVLIIEVPQQGVDVSAYSNGIEYYVYLVPTKSNLEAGTLTLTNGSKNVAITGGAFDKVNMGESIVITGSGLGNDGLYTIGSVVSDSLVLLADTFTGTTESGLKWKIVPFFGQNKTP